MNMSLPKGQGLNKMVYNVDLFGEEMDRSNILDLKRIGETEQIDFSYSGFISNTLDCHHLICKARDEGGLDFQDRVQESVLGRNLGRGRTWGNLWC